MNPSIDQNQVSTLKRFRDPRSGVFSFSLKFLFLFFLLFFNFASIPSAWAVPGGWSIFWSDEFNQADNTAPNSATWNYDTGNNSGWGNGEWENYTNSINNSFITSDAGCTDGKCLDIKTINVGGGVNGYTSARLQTSGKQSFQYGWIEARMKIPYGQGIWPAFWMLGTNIGSVGWPTCGEMDIMENIGNAGDQGNSHGTIHGPGYSGAGGLSATYTLPGGAKFKDGYHLFAINWQANKIDFYVDDVLFVSRTPASIPAGTTWVYNAPSFIILNTAVGGGWPGYPDGSTVFPQEFKIDYVRVYHQSTGPTATPTYTPTPIVASTWRVNAGGPQYTDSQGHVWAADENFIGGTAAVTTAGITGALPAASDQTLYQSERYGNPFSYVFNVPAGSYQVTLKFAEDYYGTAGTRVFNVSINGSQVMTNFDIFSSAGGEFKGIDYVFNNISPSGGAVSIYFPASLDNAKVDAIQIIPMPATATFTPTKTNTPIPPTSTFTSTSTKTNTPVPPTNTFTFTFTATKTNSPTSTNTNTPIPPTNSFTPTKTNTNTPVPPTNTFTFTRTNTPTYTSTNTPVPPTNTFTSTSTKTNTPVPATNSFTPTFTNSFTFTATKTNTPVPPTNSFTPTSTRTNTPVPPTNSFTPTDTNTAVPPTSSFTSTATRTSTSTYTPVPPTNSFTPTSTATRTNTPTSTNTNSPVPATNTPSFTSTSTNSPVATATSTFTKTFTNTSTSSFTSTPTRSYTPTVIFTSTPTKTSTPSFTSTLSATPTQTATKTNSFSPTATSTAMQTATFSPTRTFTPRPGPTPPIVIYPNPSSGGPVSLHIPGLTGVSDVRVEIFTSAFRKVKDQDFGQVGAGTDVILQLTDRWGNPLASGLYYIVVYTNHGKIIGKLLILR